MKEGNTKVLNVSISPRGKKIKQIKQWARLGKNSGSVPNALESCLAGEWRGRLTELMSQSTITDNNQLQKINKKLYF